MGETVEKMEGERERERESEMTGKEESEMKRPVLETVSYEEERSRYDFDDIVRKNMEKYRSEKDKSNNEVLDDISREEGEDIPNVHKLLAWAKGTRKPNTETFVVRSKKKKKK